MRKTYSLTTENIDILSADIQAFLQQQKQRQEHIIKARLSAETALLRWLECGYQNAEVTLECKNWLGRPIVRILMEGNPCDPLEAADDYENYFNLILVNIGNIVTFQYTRKTNIIEIKLPFKPFAMWQKNLIAVICSVITWAVVSMLVPSISGIMNTYFVTPTFKMLIGLIKGIASFMIFFNVLDAICHMGNLNTLSQMGSKVIARAEKNNIIATLLTAIVCFVGFDVVNTGGSFNAETMHQLYKIILDIVPSSLIKPFMDGNTLQILFISVFGGILLLILGQQTPIIFKTISELNSLFMLAIARSCVLIPLIVYLSFTSLLLSNKFMLLLKMWKIFLVIYGVGIVFMILEFLYTAFTNGFNLKNYFSKISPVAFLAYTVGTTMPCVPFMAQTFTKCKVDEHYRDFAFPLCQILNKPGHIIGMMAAVIGLIDLVGVTLSLSGFIIIIFNIFLLAQTAPPVKGGTISVLLLILANMNIPQEYIASIISVDYFFSMMRIEVNMTSIMHTVFTIAKQGNKLGTNL